MKTFARLIALLCALGIVRADTELTVSAAASLSDALKKIQPLYAQAHPDVKLTFNFGGSGTLQQQIDAGAPVDVFISAAAQPMDALEKKGRLLAGSRRDLLTNTLVLVTLNSFTAIKDFRDLTKPEVRHIAIGDPRTVPAGAYAMEVFESLGLTEAVTPKLVRLLDVRQALATVESKDAEVGLVYRTDVSISENIQVITTAKTRTPIVYPIAVVADTKKPSAANDFAAFLSSEAARAVFTALGFGPPP